MLIHNMLRNLNCWPCWPCWPCWFAHFFSLLCCGIFVFVFVFVFYFILCLVDQILPISMDCPFSIVPSVFSSVSLYMNSDSWNTIDRIYRKWFVDSLCPYRFVVVFAYMYIHCAYAIQCLSPLTEVLSIRLLLDATVC